MPLTRRQCDKLQSLRDDCADGSWKTEFRACLERWRSRLLPVEYDTFQALLNHDYGVHACCEDKDFTTYIDSLSPELYADFGPNSPDAWVWPESSAHASGRAH